MDKLKQALDSHTWAVNGNFSVHVKQIDDDLRVRALVLDIISTVANSAAGAVTVYPSQLATLLSLIHHDSPLLHVRATGRMLRNIMRHLTGRASQNAGVSIAGAGGTATVRHRIVLPMELYPMASPLDTAQEGKLLKDGKSFECILNPSAAVGAGGGGAQTVTAAQIKPYVLYAPPIGGRALTSALHMDWTDWAGQEAELKSKGGMVLGHLYDESDDIVDATQYTSGTLRADGKDLYTAIPIEELVAEFNERACHGASQDVELEQLPLSGNVPFLPFYTCEQGAKETQLPHAESQFHFNWPGSATAAKLVTVMVQPTTQEQAETAMGVKGYSDLGQVEPKTLKGAPLSVEADPKRALKNARLLPKRYPNAKKRG